jgi:thioredoxin reductase
MVRTDVAIVGAGPYGLSIAAHLAAGGTDVHVFGRPMNTWRTAMPKGMVLKSEGFASSLDDPAGDFPLAAYCAERGLPYANIGLPVPLQTFIDYGTEFQRRFVPMLDTRMVSSVVHSRTGFELVLEDGTAVSARRVVVATGICNLDYMPPRLLDLPRDLLSHSCAHSDPTAMAGKEVLIIGAGASAIDLAALLHQAGASVKIATRRASLAWCGEPRPRSWLDRIREPVSGLGTGWRSWMCVNAPLVFHAMPESFRLLVVRKHLGPAPGWFVRNYLEQNVPVVMCADIAGAREHGGRAKVTFALKGGDTETCSADHVVAATGYRPDIRRLDFLGDDIVSRLRCTDNTPILDHCFQSSVAGLYFTGLLAANSFGPLLRFAYGAAFTARRLAKHLQAASVHQATAGDPALVTAES